MNETEVNWIQKAKMCNSLMIALKFWMLFCDECSAQTWCSCVKGWFSERNGFALKVKSLDNVCDMFPFDRLLLAIFINDNDKSLF